MLEFAVFARFNGKDNTVFMKDVRRGFGTLDMAVTHEKELKSAGARTTMVLFDRSVNVIYVRPGMR